MRYERLLRYLPKRQKKKSSSIAAVITVARVPEMKKNAVKLKGILHTMT